MHLRRSAAAIVSGLLVTGAALGLSSPASAANDHGLISGPSPAAASPAAAPTGVYAELVVRARNGHAFVNSSSGHSTWQDLGGKFLSTPAIAYSSKTHAAYIVGVGTNKELFVRSSRSHAGWQPLVSANNSCTYSPTVKISGSTLAVACTGSGSSRVYAGTTTLPTDGSNPTVSRLVDQGGISRSGPTLTVNQGHLLLVVISSANSEGNIYTRYLTEKGNVYHRSNGFCAAQIGLTNDLNFVACQNGSTARQGGTGTNLFFRAGSHVGLTGKMSGGAAAVANSTSSQGSFFVVATTGEVFAMNASTSSTGGFHGLGGKALPGVSAAPIPQAVAAAHYAA